MQYYGTYCMYSSPQMWDAVRQLGIESGWEHKPQPYDPETSQPMLIIAPIAYMVQAQRDAQKQPGWALMLVLDTEILRYGFTGVMAGLHLKNRVEFVLPTTYGSF